MKKLILTIATIFVVVLNVTANNNKESFTYNGEARITILSSERGELNLINLATVNGYKVLYCNGQKAIVEKYNKKYELARVETNRDGKIIKATFNMIYEAKKI